MRTVVWFFTTVEDFAEVLRRITGRERYCKRRFEGNGEMWEKSSVRGRKLFDTILLSLEEVKLQILYRTVPLANKSSYKLGHITQSMILDYCHRDGSFSNSLQHQLAWTKYFRGTFVIKMNIEVENSDLFIFQTISVRMA